MTTPKLLFFAGSSRKESVNKKLAKAASEIAAKHGAEATFIDMIDYDMPIFNEDLEREEGAPDAAQKFKALLVEHDGFFIASPEYNSTFSALLKNAIDWSTRPSVKGEAPLVAFKGKVAALGAASPGGLGGLRGLPPLRVLLGNIGVHVLPEQIAVGGAFQAFDDNGALSDADQAGMLERVVRQLVDVSRKLKG